MIEMLQRLGVLLACLTAPLALAQTNGFSFTRADESAIDFRNSRSTPGVACTELIGHQSLDFRIISAVAFEGGNTIADSCTVKGIIAPAVEFVVNLPTLWGGRLYVHGNGGYGGESVHGSFGVALRSVAVRHGFATAFTNLGHDADKFQGASWALDNRKAEIDYSYRALHRTTVAAKEVIAAYYGRPPTYSYFEGCSTGGGQGLKAAQRYPEDFDGIAIGAPVFDFVGLQLYGWTNQMAVAKTPLSAAKVQLLADVVVRLFDDLDGLADGVIDDPRRIDFEPVRDLPQSTVGGAGFSEAELAALTMIYRGPAVDGRPIYPGIPIGAESAGQKYKSGSNDPAPSASGWATRLFPDASNFEQQRDNVSTWLKYLAFAEDDPDFDWMSLDIRRDLPKLQYMAEILNGTDTDLSEFQRRGGRILMYHGWADTGVNPLMTAEYYDRVTEAMGPETASFFRTFMVPGMFHCRGGVNVDRFDAITPVIEWVEADIAPDTIIAARMEEGRITRTRPLCAYPHVARYKGSGSPDSAASFDCTAP